MSILVHVDAFWCFLGDNLLILYVERALNGLLFEFKCELKNERDRVNIFLLSLKGVASNDNRWL